MLFTSLVFGIFLFLSFIIYWFMPERFRRIILIVVNCWFCIGWGYKFCILLGAEMVLSYFAAILMENTAKKKYEKAVFVSALCLSLLPLLLYKYFNFFSEFFTELISIFSVQLHSTTLKLAMPVGISFYTFQIAGYLIDVHRGRLKAERNFGVYLLFASFFPQLISGPIGRGEKLLPQFRQLPDFEYRKAACGLKLMVWGYFKKIVIADQLSVFVDAVYGNLHECCGGTLLLAVFFFSIQIYCDFSGYSDIAIGCARLFGIELSENFKSPYFSSSIREFWSRWHISLSTWFRDYLYIPLGGSRRGLIRTCLNLMITFAVSGLWHGAAWTFILWGTVHGAFQVLERLMNVDKAQKKSGIRYWLKTLCVFVLVSLLWVFFRAEKASDALYVITGMFSGITSPAQYIADTLSFLHESMKLSTKMVVFCLAVLGSFDYASLRTDVIAKTSEFRPALKYLIYLTVGVITLLCHSSGNVSFIYFQF